MTLQEFYDLLEEHDWYYEYTDDHSVWSKWHRNYKKLHDLSCKSTKHTKLFLAYKKSIFEQEELPKRPE